MDCSFCKKETQNFFVVAKKEDTEINLCYECAKKALNLVKIITESCEIKTQTKGGSDE